MQHECGWGGERYARAEEKREQEVIISSRKQKATYRYLILYFIYNICLFFRSKEKEKRRAIH
jgi:hypothetical protein